MKNLELHSCAAEKSIMSFPMGALCIKTAINKAEGLPKARLYEHTLADDPERAAQEVANRDPQFVGLSMYIWNSSWMEAFARAIRKALPNAIVFAGGPQVSAFRDGLPDYLDFATIGEGEISTVNALQYLVSGKQPQTLQGQGIITRAFISPVSSPAPDLAKQNSVFLSGEADAIIDGYDSVLWEMTRGCPFACAFCFESRGKRTVRDYPLDRIEKELSYLIKHDVQNVFVLDPTFNLNPERAKTILGMLIDCAPDHMHFTFEVRAELLDEEMADMFAQLNCSLQIGLQSSDEEVLKTIGRKFDKKQFQEKVGLLSKRGISFGIDIIIGLPKDTLKKFKNTVNFAVSLMPSNIDCFVLSLLPGTELAERQQEFGLLSDGSVLRNVISTPSFCKADLASAFAVRDGLDLFYTKGESCMWIHCILEALNITACNLFSLFMQWMEQTDRSPKEDIWELQDDFVTSLFEKTQNTKMLPAMLSFMELHQGICYVTDCGEPAPLELSYHPDELALLDKMSLSEFSKTHRQRKCTPTVVLEDGEIRFY